MIKKRQDFNLFSAEARMSPRNSTHNWVEGGETLIGGRVYWGGEMDVASWIDEILAVYHCRNALVVQLS